MKSLRKPNFSVNTVLSHCISNMREPMRQLLLDSSTVFVEHENEFIMLIETNSLYKIKRNIAISGIITQDVLKKLYTDRFVDKENSARRYYDAILLSAIKEKCPLCNQRIADTLDHYLPKSKYPLLSISPVNLVPACSACNRGKLISSPLCSEEETLHPYFDNIDNDIWLKCDIIEAKPFIIKYYVCPPETWNNILTKRVINHFNSFNLNKLYVSHGLEEMENSRYYLEKLYRNGGEGLLKEHLSDIYTSKSRVDKNSWQSALYDALYQDDRITGGKFI
jgi:hypothetical protein